MRLLITLILVKLRGVYPLSANFFVEVFEDIPFLVAADYYVPKDGDA